ncbi:carbon starvation protein CstA [Fervidicella metallireducens AeB]|uniref:Carbon starvation protein CstA n=1 Tax=Fervidicella metallireducens AeB TaxID=1403537 RepID=A0A017RS16_9CLOT|nr:carbon starvation protein A [Fervidicella metallireducens]EYE87391.1 carbon starvation protein CstA [Fervidicella metallireducens AeB]
MNSLWLLVVGIILFILAYVSYGGYLAKKWGIDPKRETPSHTKYDNIDYVPTNSKVLLGHHFSSIAGAGPIAGPIQAAIFGWLPVYLWIIIGSIFVGGVHDFGSMFASVRHDGKSIGEIIKSTIGKRGKILFNLFAWLALVLVVAAFTDITASTFAFDQAKPELLAGARAGTASVLFIALAVIFGFAVYRKGAGLAVSSVAGVILLFICVYIGYIFPIFKFSKLTWQIILLIYITFASILPVWLLLQPRDYLSSFLLYAMVIGAILGIIITHPTLQISATTAFTVGEGAKAQYLFPILFVTVACGAVSGFHSLVGSGTSSKQIDKEEDTKLIGYGAMLIEGVVAIIALISVAYVAKAEGTPASIFASGVAEFMSSFGVPVQVGKVFVTLAFASFALTSLDTATRIARYIFQEFFEEVGKGKKSILTNTYVATIVTVAASIGLLVYGYTNIWPIFGASNQLVAGLSLLALTAWFAKTGKKTIMTLIPMIFMFCVTLTALVILIRNFFIGGKTVLLVVAVLLLVLAIVLIIETATTFKNVKTKSGNIKA